MANRKKYADNKRQRRVGKYRKYGLMMQNKELAAQMANRKKYADSQRQCHVGKYGRYRLMMQNKELAAHLPETQLFSEQTLWKMLEKYGVVIIKPNNGSIGRKVIKISFLGDGLYEIHQEQRQLKFTSKVETYSFLNETYFDEKCYIIQEFIPLATIKNCPFDIRVMIQRKRDLDEWTVTGIAAKVAARGYIITNITQRILSGETAIERSTLNCHAIEVLLAEIKRIALIAVISIKHRYPNCRGVGLDIGVDEKGRIRVIEANLKPRISIFERLNDLPTLQKIKQYQRG
jgi:glutathione synthase/RimK-type ligase-like ATP-grasp enzyme